MMRILFHNHRNHRLRSLSIYALLTLFPLMANAQVGEYRTDLAIGVNGGYMMNRISFQPEARSASIEYGWHDRRSYYPLYLREVFQ